MVIVTLYCAIVGVVGSAFEVNIDKDSSVYALMVEIKTSNEDIKCPASQLRLFLAKKADGERLMSNDLLLRQMRKGETLPEVVRFYMNEELDDPTKKISTIFIREGAIHVLVVVPEAAGGPVLLQQENSATHWNVLWFGFQISEGKEEGINLNDERTLPRNALTARIIDRLGQTHVVLVNSPSMTGKTSLAASVSRALVNRHEDVQEFYKKDKARYSGRPSKRLRTT